MSIFYTFGWYRSTLTQLRCFCADISLVGLLRLTCQYLEPTESCSYVESWPKLFIGFLQELDHDGPSTHCDQLNANSTTPRPSRAGAESENFISEATEDSTPTTDFHRACRAEASGAAIWAHHRAGRRLAGDTGTAIHTSEACRSRLMDTHQRPRCQNSSRTRSRTSPLRAPSRSQPGTRRTNQTRTR
jgi:hypothetical protein